MILLARALNNPASVLELDATALDLLIRQARAANLLPRLAELLHAQNLLDQLPQAARAHFSAIRVITEKQHQALRWEINRIQDALKDAVPAVILLKGAAYVMADLPTGRGRFFGDVDLLVPKAQLNATEAALMLAGWISTHHDAYYQRYYRDWMHELPPMIHLTRKTVLDVHHTILPETARLHPDAQKLIDAAIPVPGYAKLKVLAPVDMLLHSATHLFHEGEFDKGLRDLNDLDSLLRHFSRQQPDFWPRLLARAAELDLTRPLYYALRYSARILATPIPPEVLQTAQQHAPNTFLLWLMDALFERVFQAFHTSCEGPLSGIARYLLFVRSHWLKMPFPMLVRHLFHKAFVSPKDATT